MDWNRISSMMSKLQENSYPFENTKAVIDYRNSADAELVFGVFTKLKCFEICSERWLLNGYSSVWYKAKEKDLL